MFKKIFSFLAHFIGAIISIAVIGIVLLIALITILVHSCAYKGYDGAHPDLYTVAVNNIFGIYGECDNGEKTYAPYIKIIETDDFGRVLFFYDELISSQIDYGMAFVISQKTEDGYVYYYQDDCYLPYFGTHDDIDTVLENLDPSFLETLKQRNDWNLPINESKCLKSELIKEHPKSNIEQEPRQEIEAYAKANGYDESYLVSTSYYRFCNSDLDGKKLYYVYGCITNTDENGKTISESFVFAIIINSNGILVENGIVEIEDPRTSHDLIKALKEQCKWKY